MKSRAIRSLAALLIAAFVASLWPLSITSAAAATSAQPETRSQAKRGKNGSSGSRTAPARSAHEDAQDSIEEARPGPSKPQPQPQQSRPAPAQSQPRGSGDDSFDRGSQRTQAGQAQQPSVTRNQEPPPFDRPPINPGTRSQSEPAASVPAYPAPERTTQDSRATRPSDTTAGQQRPTLRYPSDSRNTTTQPNTPASRDADNDRQEDRARGPKPVLRKPSDSTLPADRSSQQRGGDQTNQSEPANKADDNNPDDDVIKLESTLVNIPLLVSDRSGRYIPRLSKSDFQLYEDGVEQEIATFSSEEVPFNVVLLLDMSPSVQGSVDAIQDAALAFVRQMRPQDRVMIATFDRSVQYLTDFTTDRRRLEYAIRTVSTGAGTSVYDAVYETVARRLRNVEGRKALILFSDGEDTTSSHADYDEAVDMVSESDVLVYGLRYPGGAGNIQVNPWPGTRIPQIPFPLPWPWPRRRRGPFHLTGASPYTSSASPATAPQWQRRRGGGGDFMADIAAAGGGPVYDANQINDLSRLANQIAEELRHIYVVSYYPTNKLSNGGYRSIRIRVRARDNLAIRHRKGYNAGEVNRASRTE